MLARLFVLLVGSALAAAQAPTFGSQYTGDGTYYGDQSGAGHCSFQFSNSFTLPWTTGVYTGVAVNAPQYSGSAPCGMCIAFWGTGPGAGANPISPTVQYAIATDECPECLSGSLDLAQNGDGRWTIDWYPVQCNVGSSNFQYSFATGSSATYVKMAITNTRVPATSVSIEVGGAYQAMSKTTDNYWLATSGPYTFPTSVQVTSILGDIVTDVVNVASPSGAVVGAAQFPLSAAYETVGGGAATPTTTTAATPEATAAATPEATAAATPEPTAAATPEATAAATPEPTLASPTVPSAESPPPPTPEAFPAAPYASATVNYTVNASAPAPPVPPGAEATPVPVLVAAGTQPASDVVANLTSPASPGVTEPSSPGEEALPPSAVSSPRPVAVSNTPDGKNALVSTPANCTLSVAALQQCGGRGGVCANQGPDGSQCRDAQWDNACCTSGYYCKRSQQWSWTCQRTMANTTQSSGGVVADYRQCGGLGNCAEDLCADAEWEGYSCYGGFTCLRWDAFYWQCRDVPFAQAA